MNGVPLNLLSDNLLLNITTKMQNTCISRMKRTCSSMNLLVKENHRLLESRTKIGLVLRIIIDESITGGIEILAVKSGKRTNLETLELSHHGISISLLSIVCTGGNTGIFETLIQSLSRIRLICGSAEINDFPAEFVVRLLECIDCRHEIKINHYSEDIKEFLQKLGTDPHCSQFSVKSSSRGYNSDGIFKLLSGFHSFDGCSFSPSSFNRLLWDICSHNNSGNLHWVFCSIQANNDDILRGFPFSDLPTPPLKVLWDKSLVSEYSVIPSYAPNCIRLMNLRSKRALVVERIHCSCADEDIFFVDPDPCAVLDVLLRELSITLTESVRNEYLNGTEDEQLHILQRNI